ncbi:hypothetical protein KCP74_14510 [Salmonella enterica subsp. enterica]|nr:hypothetical protein KCP74_14510 [Salmonella enterica subsp. enterica]
MMSSFRYVAFTAWVATMPPMPVKWVFDPDHNRRSSFVNQRFAVVPVAAKGIPGTAVSGADRCLPL